MSGQKECQIRDKTPIEAEMCRLEEAQKAVDAVVERLARKLTPVCSPESPCNPEAPLAPGTGGIPLVDELSLYTRCALRVQQQLQDILDRLGC